MPAAYNFVDGCSHGYNYASQSVHGWSLFCVCVCARTHLSVSLCGCFGGLCFCLCMLPFVCMICLFIYLYVCLLGIYKFPFINDIWVCQVWSLLWGKLSYLFVLKFVHHLKVVVHLEEKIIVLAEAIKVTRTARETAGRGGRKNKTCQQMWRNPKYLWSTKGPIELKSTAAAWGGGVCFYYLIQGHYFIWQLSSLWLRPSPVNKQDSMHHCSSLLWAGVYSFQFSFMQLILGVYALYI